MAYNSFYPQYPQQYQMPQQQYQMPQQIQDVGIVGIRDENEILSYPVGYGKSVTFKIENKPYLYTKTMGFSQLDKPVIEKYKLIKEDISSASEAQTEPLAEKADNSRLEKLEGEIDKLWAEIEVLKKKSTAKKKEVIADDTE